MPPIQPPVLNSSSDVLSDITPNYKHLIHFSRPDVLAEPNYRPLSLTFIEYLDGDKLGFILAWFSMLPFIYIVALCTLIIFRRDIQTIMYFGGFVISGIINHYLKITFKQQRPERTRHRMDFYDVYGMPSGHAQSFFYFMTYLSIFLFLKSQGSSTTYIRSIRNRCLLLVQPIAAILVAYSRVYLYYHTIAQVVVGSFIGTILGGLWYYFINYQFIKYVSFIIDQPLAKYFLIRDYSSIPNIIQFQYDSECAEAKRCRARYVNSSRDSIMLTNIP
ncbi:unnamed protein product [Rotaria socialis]|uniref:Dolichyldiphosphatase n=1 Tax=Rotaria socialis TaxID=392032 RepID=A0A820M102_9BILA|nr:unnamed protein product [Rotaria socialis]CAF3785053.1 unnamed protein product [Rotaria socialis]CAF4365346.1 unnamed protein product [Rotaria socialis]CAF4584746.1 unnamed protein product [Rotaria socialis]